jgi:hypothetical protein
LPQCRKIGHVSEQDAVQSRPAGDNMSQWLAIAGQVHAGVAVLLRYPA